MEKEIKLFNDNLLTFKYKFYYLIDLLLSNQSESIFEPILLMIIFYLQIISSFFSEQVGIFDPENSKSDKLLNLLLKIIRVKGLFKENYNDFKILILIIFNIFIIIIIHFIISCLNISRDSFYSNNITFINYYIKIFLYIGYNIIFDISFSNFCFGLDELNPNFSSVKCSFKDNRLIAILSIIFIFLSFFIYIFITIYYNDSFYFSNSYYAKISSNYDIYWGINCLLISCLSNQIKYTTKELFLIYNFLVSILLFVFYIKHYLYYNKYINLLTGSFHILYVWTSIFCFIFNNSDFTEKGIVYIFTSIIVCFLYSSIKKRIESKIFLETPFYKINNQYYLLLYFHNLIEKINNIEENIKDKSFLSGIIQMHELECPSSNCILKTKENLFLPLNNKWNDKRKEQIDDEVYQKYFIIEVMNYFINVHKCSADMYLNFSLYYLKIIGNYCQAIYYFRKVTELKLSLKEYYSLFRLNIQISIALLEKLKPSNEQCNELESLDISQYFKYDDLSKNFLDEINNDINLSLEFWKSFKEPLKEQDKTIDFNKIFKLTDNIRITKIKIENMWNDLFKIYGGVNDFFMLYMDYVEQINDDGLKKRDLETLKRKNDNYIDYFNNNYYSILFNKRTGIIIANGDKGNEGIIQLANNEIENIFKYKPIDLKGLNLTNLMPKIFALNHSKYIEKYFKIGQKKFIDKPGIKIFATDKKNSIIKVKLAIKLFPILNENVLFVSLIVKENIDDIILLDNNFIIQGMSLKLMKILNINNCSLFQDNEIPFYVICKKFINFYNIFLKYKIKKNIMSDKKILNYKEKDKENNKEETKYNKDDILENIEINENVELEYEIKLPKFLIDYSEKTNKNINLDGQEIIISSSYREDVNESNEESDEKDLLLKSDNNINNNNNNKNFNVNYNFPSTITTPTPYKETSYPFITPQFNIDNQNINEQEKIIDFNKKSEEERIYLKKMNEYKTLFNKEKMIELENLIDECNKNSESIEYKFNFTFRKFIYGDKQISFIIRCIDSKNTYENIQEESDNEKDLNAIYKKEKIESIKRLYEIYDNEKIEIMEMEKEFLQMSLDDKKFQKLLLECKNDINNLSTIHGQKNDIMMEDENSSQSTQTGFDSKLVKKNRIEEIRSNILVNISSFYTLKYIKMTFILFIILTAVFSVFYIYFFSSLYTNLKNTSILNNNLYLSTLWTTQIISIFISLRTLYQKYIINNENFKFYDYFSDYHSLGSLENNNLYYNECLSKVSELYNKSSYSFKYLEMEISNYLNEEQLMDIFWNVINISYMNESYYVYSKVKDNETYPMAIDQFLSNTIYFIENDVFNSTDDITKNKFYNEIDIYQIYFNYITYLIIENGYDNILPNQIEKLKKIPDILTKYNLKRRKGIIFLVSIYLLSLIIISHVYFFFIMLTNKSMTDGIKKVTKIQLEKIEEIIKRIKIFNINVKRFREKQIKINDNKSKKYSKVDENENLNNLKKYETAITEKDITKKVGKKPSLMNNSGFSDEKKYIPLHILVFSFFPPLIIFIIICIFLIPIFILTLNIVNNVNRLLLVQNYMLGRLIISSIKTIEIKCFLSECQNKTYLNSNGLVNMDIMEDVLKGINIFTGISQFYHKKFLFNACEVAIDPEIDPEKYQKCLNDPLIINSNNTDNLLEIIEVYSHNLLKNYEMEISINSSFYRKSLYSSTLFNYIEYIYYNYLYQVGDSFTNILYNNLDNYLMNEKIVISIIIIVCGVFTIIYCFLYQIILIKKLMNYLSISRCIMRIIPISIIISTKELEDWIESKF